MTAPLAIVPTIVNVGYAALLRAQGDGLQAQLSHMAIGRGVSLNGHWQGYTPAITMSALQHEDAREPLLSGQKIDHGFRVLGRFDPTAIGAAELPIWEVGFYLSTGELLCLWSHEELWALTTRTPLAGVDLSFELHLDQVPIEALTINVLEPDIPDTAPVLARLVALGARDLTQTAEAISRELAVAFGAANS